MCPAAQRHLKNEHLTRLQQQSVTRHMHSSSSSSSSSRRTSVSYWVGVPQWDMTGSTGSGAARTCGGSERAQHGSSHLHCCAWRLQTATPVHSSAAGATAVTCFNNATVLLQLTAGHSRNTPPETVALQLVHTLANNTGASALIIRTSSSDFMICIWTMHQMQQRVRHDSTGSKH
jgi:hypothetical protein